MRIIVFCLATTIFPMPSFAGEQVTLFDGMLSFELPDGFSTVTKEVAQIKYPIEASRPKYIYSNSATTTSIAVDVNESSRLQPQQLAEFKSFMEQSLARMIPGLRWVKKQIITLYGTEWIRLEFISNAIDTDIHNIMLMTAFKGKPLIFNFNSTKEEFASVEKEIIASIQSVEIRLTNSIAEEHPYGIWRHPGTEVYIEILNTGQTFQCRIALDRSVITAAGKLNGKSSIAWEQIKATDIKGNPIDVGGTTWGVDNISTQAAGKLVLSGPNGTFEYEKCCSTIPRECYR